MTWLAPGKQPVVTTIILQDKSIAKNAAQRWAREKQSRVRVGVWLWWTDGSRSDNGRAGAAAVCKRRNDWRTHRSNLGTGLMEVFDAHLWAIGLALGGTVKRRE